METVGRIADVAREFTSNKVRITFVINELPSDLEDLTGCDTLDITVRRHTEKRSLTANAYFHKLVSLIAQRNKESITERKNSLIAEYGQFDETIKNIILDDEIDWRQVGYLHLMPTTATRVLDNGRLYRVYHVMRGSHTYSVAEMSRLIDGTVEQAKELGIETLPPAELARMKAAWTQKN